ncbi:MAG TPA: MFS transporter [Hyphomicrobiales bacterium]|nr:MFS transporter [Hyphomicrobiales bacterium]
MAETARRATADSRLPQERAAGLRAALAVQWPVLAEFVVIFLGSTLPTPLYVIWRQSFHFSEIVLTLIYAAYAGGTLLTLVTLGKLSDLVGRRPVSLAGLAVAAASTAVFIAASNITMLFVARTLSGISIGLAAGAGTAWIAELDPAADRPRATSLTVAANFIGLALGPLSAGLLASFVPWPLTLCFVLFLLPLALGGAVVFGARETVAGQGRAIDWAAIRPRFGVPREVAPQFVAPAATAFGIFTMLGFYAALTPGVLARSLHVTSPAVAGAVVAEAFAVAAVATIASARLKSRDAMLGGLGVLLAALALLVAAELLPSLIVLLVATAVVGVAAGLGYRGSLQVVNQIAPEERRAEVVSTYLLACYFSISLPVIGVGVLGALASPIVADLVLAGVVGLIAIAALAAGMRYAPRE